jgi:putative holliday junction resolvase
MESRRLMALDYGFKRIGVALSDPLAMFAKPHSIIYRTTNQADFALIKQIISSEEVVKLVIGLPIRSHSELSEQAEKVIKWARKLANEIEIPLVFWDESYSSETAETITASTGRKTKDHAKRIDDVAAAVFLQDYLDAGGAHHEPGRTLDNFPSQSQ